MILEQPQVFVEQYDGLKIMKSIERAMRTCYRSEGMTTEDSYKRLLKMAIDSGHESVLEHEKITVKLRCSIGTYKDLTRHRAGIAFSIESTRWCNYIKDKFDNEIKFIKPVFYTPGAIEDYDDPINKNNCLKTQYWQRTMQEIENAYMDMTNIVGATPDEMRMILPHSTAADVVMTCNIREWRHILKLRTQNNVHPEIRQLLIPLLLKFQYDMPDLFEDITYNKAFPKNWYAEIKELKGVDNND